MSAPKTRDPLVVNTQDGSCWLRRAVTRDGRGLYALEGTPRCCPEYVLASLPELAEIGLRGMADALPMPVGTEDSSARGDKELARLRARVAELEDVERRLLALLPTQPLPTVMLAEGVPLRAERAVWEQVAEVLGESLPYVRPVNEDRIAYALTERAAAIPGFCRNESPYGRRCDQPSGHDGDHAMADGAGGHFGWPASDDVSPEALHASSGAVIPVPSDDVRPQVQTLRGLLARQREDVAASPLHHDYRIGRDLPEVQS